MTRQTKGLYEGLVRLGKVSHTPNAKSNKYVDGAMFYFLVCANDACHTLAPLCRRALQIGNMAKHNCLYLFC